MNDNMVHVACSMSMVPIDQRICQRCDYFQTEFCTHPKVSPIELDLVTGEIIENKLHCSSARSLHWLCGKQGRYWTRINQMRETMEKTLMEILDYE